MASNTKKENLLLRDVGKLGSWYQRKASNTLQEGFVFLRTLLGWGEGFMAINKGLK